MLRLRSLVRQKKEYRIKIIGYSNTTSVVTAIIISGILISASVVYLAKRIESAEKTFYYWTETNIEEIKAFNALIEEGKSFREAFTWKADKADETQMRKVKAEEEKKEAKGGEVEQNMDSKR